MKHLATTLAVALLLTACAPLPTGDSSSAPDPFTAHGNEPFWWVELQDGRMRLRQAGEPEGTVDPSRLRVEQGLCHDSMSGMPYPYRAWLTLDGREWPGCGGDPRELLEGVVWELDGTALESPPTLAFLPDNRVAGRGGCNRYSGTYRLTGEGLRLGPLAATKMLCRPAQMTVEQGFFEALEAVHRFDLNEGGSLELHGAGQKSLSFHPRSP
ncbi:META domain-containing protein [Alkalilimnicola sp. S0819]|uniref:META domain-containing protein n=1 Tax=Alkalilimnicola sp. S0819 TaxID=2613922 RepID=UPI0012621D63|nr:META domain-containing protein [Alkalilimnicola sp. S0819]KAB7628255.1 META domain-containing protein [Alkalilimnicola sp. S0819]MPQ15149.1 META domain-containing protein [Alkalilimnicola sp. S0819]